MGEKCLIRCTTDNLSEVGGEDIDERLNERQWQPDSCLTKERHDCQDLKNPLG
jgi:hypothetical protein